MVLAQGFFGYSATAVLGPDRRRRSSKARISVRSSAPDAGRHHRRRGRPMGHRGCSMTRRQLQRGVLDRACLSVLSAVAIFIAAPRKVRPSRRPGRAATLGPRPSLFSRSGWNLRGPRRFSRRVRAAARRFHAHLSRTDKCLADRSLTVRLRNSSAKWAVWTASSRD